MKRLETYFVRHPQKKISLDVKTRKRMWREKRVFIHFEWDKSGNRRTDSRSKDPEDYEGSAKRAVSTLRRLAKEGGYVCGHFDEYEKWMMGKVLPNSRVELREGKWPESDRPKYHDGRCAFAKSVLFRRKFTKFCNPHSLAKGQSCAGQVLAMRLKRLWNERSCEVQLAHSAPITKK